MPLCGHHLLLAVTVCGVLVGCQKPSSVSKRHDVYIAGFFPFSPEMLPETATGRGVMPAVKLAIEHINENSAVLRNYRLHMWWNDTQVRVRAFQFRLPNRITITYGNYPCSLFYPFFPRLYSVTRPSASRLFST